MIPDQSPWDDRDRPVNAVAVLLLVAAPLLAIGLVAWLIYRAVGG